MHVCSVMDTIHLLWLLLCVSPLVVSGVGVQDDDNEVYRWSKQSVPVVLDRHTEILDTPNFWSQEEDDKREGTWRLCGIECQSTLPPLDQTEQEKILGYETMYANGTCTQTKITLLGFNKTSPRALVNTSTQTRKKRQVYGEDGRFVISDSRFTTNYPFSTAVRLSTGCSGILVSPKHVLTAAHCVHDGKDYLEGMRRLKVGVLQLKSKRGKGRRRMGGRRRGGRGREGETRDEKIQEGTLEEGEEWNSIDGKLVRGRQGGGVGRRRGRGRKGDVEGTGAQGGIEGQEIRRRGNPKRRMRRSAELKKWPVFRWTQVKQTRIPNGWIHAKNSPKSVAPDYDYALLELKQAVKQKHMKLGVAPSAKALTRIHFSGYDTEKVLLDGLRDEKIVYRFCSVAKESDDLMYQHCDAEQGAAGAGVYIRLREDVGTAGQKGKWQRKVIGVYSGHQWVEVEGGEQRDFNVAMRITPSKYAQICHWIHGDPSLCKEV
ncbi:serine protease 23-like [Lampris incognitus]|uniref:serine protease 23-like n=1 Tax=Lampris incognitus TaxID=2546036 RepID=UPI0024B52120|nr:serine protease 23-like [Lampris incognitus]